MIRHVFGASNGIHLHVVLATKLLLHQSQEVLLPLERCGCRVRVGSTGWILRVSTNVGRTYRHGIYISSEDVLEYDP